MPGTSVVMCVMFFPEIANKYPGVDENVRRAAGVKLAEKPFCLEVRVNPTTKISVDCLSAAYVGLTAQGVAKLAEKQKAEVKWYNGFGPPKANQ